jgi:hypothetical protein
VGHTKHLEDLMQHELKAWKDILEMSGRKLAPDKCNFYTINWNFNSTGKAMIDSTQMLELKIQNTEITLSRILHIHKSLGFSMSSFSPTEVQRQQWQDIENRFLLILSSYKLTFQETSILYKQIYIPKVRYLLPLSSLTIKDIHSITRETTTKFLRKSGYSNSTSRQVVFGAKSPGGLGWTNLETEQGLQSLMNFIQSFNNLGTKGNIHKVTKDRWCWFVGFAPWKHLEAKINYNESVWLKQVNNFMTSHKITMSIPYNAYPLQREHNNYLMLIAEDIQLTNIEKHDGNYC